MDSCTSPALGDTLPDYEFGTLQGEAFERFEAHLMECASCRMRLEELEPVVTEMRRDGGGAIDGLAPEEGQGPRERITEGARTTLRTLIPARLDLEPTCWKQDEWAQTLLDAGEYGEAAKHLGADKGTLSAEDLWVLGTIHFRARRDGAAGSLFEAAVVRAPAHPYYRWGAVTMALGLGELSLAQSHLVAIRDAGGVLEPSARQLLRAMGDALIR